MVVTEDHGVDRVRRAGKGPVVQFLFGLRALEKAAIDQDLPLIGFKSKT